MTHLNQDAQETRYGWVAASILAIVVIAGTIVAAMGFSSPRDKLQNHEARLVVLEQGYGDFRVVKQKVDDLSDGLNRLLDAQGLATIPKRTP